jgi:hypothetical protein
VTLVAPEPLIKVPRRRQYGAAIIDAGTPSAVIRYLSASSISTYDPLSYGGCPRRYYYKYVARKSEPETLAQQSGTDSHAKIARYLTTGDVVLDRITMAARPMMPPPKSPMLIEHEISGDPPLSNITLDAGGIPIVGEIDLVHSQGKNFGGHDIEDVDEPDGTVEAIDWKTSSDISAYGKTDDEVAKTVQMVTYGEYLARALRPRYIRLSHVYMSTRGAARAVKRGRHLTREQVGERWEYIDGLSGSIQQIARCSDVEKTPYNLQACGAYRGCPHRGYCSAHQKHSLTDFFGDILEEKEDSPVSLLDSLVGASAPSDVAALEKMLAMKNTPAVPPGFPEAWKTIAESGLGTPPLAGAAAEAFAAMSGHIVPPGGTTYTGSGSLANIAAQSDVSVILTIAGEIAKRPQPAPPPPVVAPQAQLPALLPPDAPPVQTPVATSVTTTVTQSVVASSPPRSSGGPDPAIMMDRPKRGRPPGKKKAETSETRGADGALEIYVDCLPATGAENLAPWLDEIADTLAKKFGAVDIRCASNDTELGFGRWRGALAALIKAAARQGDRALPPGAYCLDSRGDFGDIASEALRTIADVYVRGFR